MNQALEHDAPIDLIELRIPCQAEWVALARLAISAIANRLQFSIEEIEDVKLAVAEACTAVIQHEKHGEYIELTCETFKQALRLRVRDGGRHASHPEDRRVIDFDEARIAGLGVFLIRSLMDEVTCDVHPDRGTELLMVKRLSGRAE